VLEKNPFGRTDCGFDLKEMLRVERRKNGIKVLDRETWLVPDSIHRVFGDLANSFERGDFSQGERDLADLNRIVLNVAAPKEVEVMFDVAKGAMAYGWFYYPLYAVGIDRLCMAVDTAVLIKYESAISKGSRVAYRTRIVALCRAGFLGADLCEELQLAREARNEALHPQFQTITTFSQTLRSISYYARLLDKINEASFSESAAVAGKKHDHKSPLDPTRTTNERDG